MYTTQYIRDFLLNSLFLLILDTVQILTLAYSRHKPLLQTGLFLTNASWHNSLKPPAEGTEVYPFLTSLPASPYDLHDLTISVPILLLVELMKTLKSIVCTLRNLPKTIKYQLFHRSCFILLKKFNWGFLNKLSHLIFCMVHSEALQVYLFDVSFSHGVTFCNIHEETGIQLQVMGIKANRFSSMYMQPLQVDGRAVDQMSFSVVNEMVFLKVIS